MVRPLIHRRLPFLASLLLMLAGSMPAFAQWVVYDMRMISDQEVSVNFAHYSGAYLVAPLGGGAASLILTTEEGGRFYAVAQDAARFFVAGDTTKRRAVFSALAAVGTSQTMYLASGALNNTYSYVNLNEKNIAIVATELTGHLMTADDEQRALLPSLDGSKGVVGEASFKGFFRKDLSDRLNADSPTMDQAVESITGLLEKYGYESELSPRPATTGAEAAQPAPFAQPQGSDSDTTAEGSLFPPGLREEMEQSLRQQPTTK